MRCASDHPFPHTHHTFHVPFHIPMCFIHTQHTPYVHTLRTHTQHTHPTHTPAMHQWSPPGGPTKKAAAGATLQQGPCVSSPHTGPAQQGGPCSCAALHTARPLCVGMAQGKRACDAWCMLGGHVLCVCMCVWMLCVCRGGSNQTMSYCVLCMTCMYCREHASA